MNYSIAPEFGSQCGPVCLFSRSLMSPGSGAATGLTGKTEYQWGYDAISQSNPTYGPFARLGPPGMNGTSGEQKFPLHVVPVAVSPSDICYEAVDDPSESLSLPHCALFMNPDTFRYILSAKTHFCSPSEYLLARAKLFQGWQSWVILIKWVSSRVTVQIPALFPAILDNFGGYPLDFYRLWVLCPLILTFRVGRDLFTVSMDRRNSHSDSHLFQCTYQHNEYCFEADMTQCEPLL